MKNIFLILALLLATGMYAQEAGKLTGTIKDKEVFDEGVVFADVRLKDTEFRTQTNFRGNFELKDVTPGSYTLEVTYAGYETLEIPVEIKKGELTRISSAMSAKRLTMEDFSAVMSETSERSESLAGPKRTDEK